MWLCPHDARNNQCIYNDFALLRYTNILRINDASENVVRGSESGESQDIPFSIIFASWFSFEDTHIVIIIQQLCERNCVRVTCNFNLPNEQISRRWIAPLITRRSLIRSLNYTHPRQYYGTWRIFDLMTIKLY